MHRQIGLLIELQQIDLRLDAVEVEKNGIMERVARQAETLERERGELARMDDELAELRSELSEMEKNADLERENIDRSEKRLKEIKTQKEYQAVSREISAARKNLEEIEEGILSRRADLEHREHERAEQAGRVDALSREVDAQRLSAENAVRTLDESASGDRNRRGEVARDISASLLTRYDRLRDQRRGIAIVEARNGSCLGCNMNIPPQLYNNLFKTTELITCPHCQRVLYLVQQGG